MQKVYDISSLCSALIALMIPTFSFACPLCHTSTADQVRAGIVSTSLDGSTIIGLISPFVIVGIIIMFMHVKWEKFQVKKKLERL